jgi:hypothetical protein
MHALSISMWHVQSYLYIYITCKSLLIEFWKRNLTTMTSALQWIQRHTSITYVEVHSLSAKHQAAHTYSCTNKAFHSFVRSGTTPVFRMIMASPRLNHFKSVKIQLHIKPDRTKIVLPTIIPTDHVAHIFHNA